MIFYINVVSGLEHLKTENVDATISQFFRQTFRPNYELHTV